MTWNDSPSSEPPKLRKLLRSQTSHTRTVHQAGRSYPLGTSSPITPSPHPCHCTHTISLLEFALQIPPRNSRKSLSHRSGRWKFKTKMQARLVYFFFNLKSIYFSILFLAVSGLSFCTWTLSTVSCWLSCPKECGIPVPGPGIEPAPLALEGRLLPPGSPGKPRGWCLLKACPLGLQEAVFSVYLHLLFLLCVHVLIPSSYKDTLMTSF